MSFEENGENTEREEYYVGTVEAGTIYKVTHWIIDKALSLTGRKEHNFTEGDRDWFYRGPEENA